MVGPTIRDGAIVVAELASAAELPFGWGVETEMAALAEKLRGALDQALDTVRWVAGFEFPDFHHDHEMLALVTPGQYAIDRGTLATTGGLTFAPAEFEDYVIEEEVAHSTALHPRLAGRGRYLTGPTARYTLSRPRLSSVARQAADAAGLGPECRNPYRAPPSAMAPPRRRARAVPPVRHRR